MLEYVPSHFKRVLHVRPKMSCRACETIVQAPMPTLPIEKGRPGRRCSPMSSSPNIAIICRCIASPTFTRAAGWRSTAPSWRAGSAIWRRSWSRWPSGSRAMCAPAPRSMPTIRRFPCSIPAAAGRRPADYGRRCGTSGPTGRRAPPAAFYLYSPDRKAEHAHALLKGCRGHLHADAYAGFAGLYEADPKTGAPPR